MKRVFVAVVVAALSQLGAAAAAGPFDGEWTGGSPAVSKNCPSSTVTITVAGDKVTGEAVYPVAKAKIGGTIAADGSFVGSIGPNPSLKGKFDGDNFTGSYEDKVCGGSTRAMALQRKK